MDGIANPRKPYVRPVSKTSWFMSSVRYQHYMLHEVSSIFVAIYVVMLIFGLFRLGQGEAAWNAWVAGVTSPLGLIFSVIAFFFFCIHTVSWFKAVPQAMRLQRGTEIVPGKLIVGAHYAVLGAVSLFFIVLAGVA